MNGPTIDPASDSHKFQNDFFYAFDEEEEERTTHIVSWTLRGVGTSITSFPRAIYNSIPSMPVPFRRRPEPEIQGPVVAPPILEIPPELTPPPELTIEEARIHTQVAFFNLKKISSRLIAHSILNTIFNGKLPEFSIFYEPIRTSGDNSSDAFKQVLKTTIATNNEISWFKRKVFGSSFAVERIFNFCDNKIEKSIGKIQTLLRNRAPVEDKTLVKAINKTLEQIIYLLNPQQSRIDHKESFKKIINFVIREFISTNFFVKWLLVRILTKYTTIETLIDKALPAPSKPTYIELAVYQNLRKLLCKFYADTTASSTQQSRQSSGLEPLSIDEEFSESLFLLVNNLNKIRNLSQIGSAPVGEMTQNIEENLVKLFKSKYTHILAESLKKLTNPAALETTLSNLVQAIAKDLEGPVEYSATSPALQRQIDGEKDVVSKALRPVCIAAIDLAIVHAKKPANIAKDLNKQVSLKILQDHFGHLNRNTSLAEKKYYAIQLHQQLVGYITHLDMLNANVNNNIKKLTDRPLYQGHLSSIKAELNALIPLTQNIMDKAVLNDLGVQYTPSAFIQKVNNLANEQNPETIAQQRAELRRDFLSAQATIKELSNGTEISALLERCTLDTTTEALVGFSNQLQNLFPNNEHDTPLNTLVQELGSKIQEDSALARILNTPVEASSVDWVKPKANTFLLNLFKQFGVNGVVARLQQCVDLGSNPRIYRCAVDSLIYQAGSAL